MDISLFRSLPARADERSEMPCGTSRNAAERGCLYFASDRDA
jgi:hypothetical protein